MTSTQLFRTVLLLSCSIGSAATAQNGELGPRDLFLQTANSGSTSTRLSVRYALLLQQPGRGFVGVDPDKVSFGAGDQVRLSVQVSQPANIYVLQRGSSQRWGVLFPPSPSVPNSFPGLQVCEIPGSGATFTFDGRPGEELLVMIVSRDPLDAATLAGQLNERSSQTTDRSQAFKSRDLVFEKTQDDRQSPFHGTAIYASGASPIDAPVLIPIKLIHKATR